MLSPNFFAYIQKSEYTGMKSSINNNISMVQKKIRQLQKLCWEVQCPSVHVECSRAQCLRGREGVTDWMDRVCMGGHPDAALGCSLGQCGAFWLEKGVHDVEDDPDPKCLVRNHQRPPSMTLRTGGFLTHFLSY